MVRIDPPTPTLHENPLLGAESALRGETPSKTPFQDRGARQGGVRVVSYTGRKSLSSLHFVTLREQWTFALSPLFKGVWGIKNLRFNSIGLVYTR
jgi:hypothetical protein